MKDVAELLKVLADEARLKMLWLLFNHEELCVCDIMAALEITQSKASRHLATLRRAGLVADRREGLWSYYSLRPVENDLVRRHLDALKSTLAQRPEAAVLVAKVRDHLQTKERAGLCAENGAAAMAASPVAAPKRTRRTEETNP